MSPAVLALLASLAASAPAERVVALVPVGPVDPALVDAAAQAIEARLAVKVRVEAARELPRSAWVASRRRWRAEKILAALEEDPPRGAFKVVALTAAETSTAKGDVPDGRVDGVGEIGGRACLASTWSAERASRSRAELLRRVGDSVLHELGHALGLEHCAKAGCAMREGKERGEADGYCGGCRARLGQVAQPAK